MADPTVSVVPISYHDAPTLLSGSDDAVSGGLMVGPIFIHGSSPFGWSSNGLPGAGGVFPGLAIVGGGPGVGAVGLGQDGYGVQSRGVMSAGSSPCGGVVG